MLPALMFEQATGPAPIVIVDPRGDTLSPSAGTAQRAAIDALRLSLSAPVFPADRVFGSQCSDYGENAGNATGLAPFPTQRALAVRLLPSLTLAGFSRAGCAISANIGGGLVFTQPIAKSVFFAASGGYLLLPSAGQDGAATKTMAARADVVFTRPDGRAFTVGVAVAPRPSVTFGGLW